VTCLTKDKCFAVGDDGAHTLTERYA
jgi:hypothetical protein